MWRCGGRSRASVPEQWVDRARYDIETAEAMLAAGRYLYVLFCSQQAIAKMLKALIAKQTNDVPPRIHNLVRLAELAQVPMSEERTRLCEQLSAFYATGRYPADTHQHGHVADQATATDVYSQSEKVVQWLSSML